MAAIACAAATTAPAAAPPLEPRLTKALTAPSLSLGRTAALAVDVATGAVIYAHNSSLPVAPGVEREDPRLVGRADEPRAGLPLPHRGLRHRRAGRCRLGRRPDPEGLRRPDARRRPISTASRERSRDAGSAPSPGASSATSRSTTRKRGAAGWKHYFIGGETPPLSALVVDRARGWPALSPPLLAARAFREALARRGVTVAGGPASASRPCRDDARVGRLRPARGDRPPHEPRERQLLRRDAAQAARRRRPARSGRRRAAGGSSIATMREAGIPVDGGPHRRRLRALEPRSAHGRRARRRDRAGATDPTIRAAFVGSLAVAGHERDAQPAAAGAPRPGEGQDGHDEPRLHAVRPDPRHVAFAVLENGSPVSSWAARAAQDRFVTILAGAVDHGAAPASPGSRPSASSACRSASPRIGTPAFSALAAFEPGLSPTMTPVVFFETESETFAPSASSAAFACSRLNPSSVPVITYWLPGQRALRRPLLLAAPRAAARAAQVGDERAVLLVREPLGDQPRRGRGRCPRTPSSSSWRRGHQRSTVPKWRARLRA